MRPANENNDMTVGYAVRMVLRAAAQKRAADLARAVAIAASSMATIAPAAAAELPVPCAAGGCGVSGPSTWVTSGHATGVFTTNSLTINQTTNSAAYNWQSFNISSDGTVTFKQPDASSIALNRIFQADPSRIFGALNANGRVYLLNQNGILFGGGARINVGGLVASTLNITPEAVKNGLAGAAQAGQPAFEGYKDEADVTLPSGTVEVRHGAEIRTASGGQVLLFAPELVKNEGSIATPDGQTMLASGSKIYLTTSTDPELRGLLVEVGVGGTVANGAASNSAVTDPAQLVGQIVAERGNVTLAGLAVNQLGRVSANTSVRSNGSVRLLARDSAQLNVPGDGSVQLFAQRGGVLTVGENSLTSVTLDASDTSTQVDVNTQPRSQVEMFGERVNLLSRSQVIATSGDVSIAAVPAPQAQVSPENFPTTPNSGRIYMAPDARIDVSGTHVERSMESNVVRVELRGSQLADSSMQRDGVLRGATVYVDSRVSGTRADGSTWYGTSLADVSGDLATVQRGLGERNLTGGTVSLISQGDVILSDGSSIDISGGSTRFRDGYINTTQLVSNGRIYDIGTANPDRTYQGIADGYVLDHPKWGVKETFAGFTGAAPGRFEGGYVQGHDAGSLTVVAPRAILDGELRASTVIGPRQRLPSQIVPASSLYRPDDQLPLGGRLQLGYDNSSAELPNYVMGGVELSAGRVLPTLVDAGGAAFDPLADALPEDFTVTRLRSDEFQQGGVSRLTVFSNDSVRIGETTTLSLAPGGEASFTANSIEILGDISIAAGRISLTSQRTLANESTAGIRLGQSAELSARGQWVNDNAVANAPDAQLAPRLIAGGSVRISARQGGLDLAEGSAIDVSGGAWQRPDGTVTGGRGGSISLSATETFDREAVPFVLGAELSAYSLSHGGDLSIAANAVCVAAASCATEETSLLWLQPQFFEQGGFGSYQIASNRGGLEVLAGTDILLRQSNSMIVGDATQIVSGADLRSFTQVGVLDDLSRRPTNLSLSARISAGNEPYTAARFDDAPGLTLAAGASIAADPGASVSLSSNSWIVADGAISAPAGDITLSLDSSLPIVEFLPQQAIWLGATLRLDASGAVRMRPDDLGRRTGEVLDAGSVKIAADRGYIVLQPGSTIEASGTQAELDIATRPGMYERRLIASHGGSIGLTAAEGIAMSGTLLAHAGAGVGARGGTLSVSLDTSRRGSVAGTTEVFPTGTRSVRLQTEQTPVVVGPRTALPGSLNGVAVVAADAVKQGGFSSLSLSAGNVYGQSGSGQARLSTGEIRVVDDVSLSLASSLVLDAATLASDGGTATLAAQYVRFGQSARSEQNVQSQAAIGTGSLNVQAGLIDVVGRSALSGFADVSLVSRGDIRLRGIQPQGGRAITGALLTAADVTLQADQIYPTTLTQFDITVAGRPDASIRVMPGGAGQDVLSAGGTLRLNAPRIEQHGTLRAPLGTISLNGETVVLGSGSTTSTSAQGLTIPFGTTQGGFDWVYALEDDQTLVFGGEGDPVPQQRVVLNAGSIDMQAGSVVDVSGGGDLLAYEWVRGVSGTRDVLSAAERPDQFAIVPTLNLPYAPYDNLEYRDSSLTPGDSVYLYGIDGLPEGEYALLPARYALLPGAYLVTAIEGYTDLAPAERLSQLDGSTIVAGYRTIAGTGLRDSRTSGFAIRAGTTAQREARYDLSKANEFFPRRAAELDVVASRIPRDAGVLALLAGSSLTLNGELRADEAEGGRGAALDVSADRLRITGGSTQAGDEGEVLISAAALSELGAESVFIGGTRTQTEEGLALNVAAQTVIVEDGARLTGPELILAGRERVALESGAVVSATGGGASSDTALLAQGDGALLRVTSGAQSRIKRSDSTGTAGTLEIGAGALIQANGGAVTLEATLDTVSNGELQVAGGSLNLASSLISLGDAAPGTSGLVLAGADIDGLGLAELVLTSQSSIDIYGNAAFGVKNLLLEAGGLRGVGNASASITAGEVLAFSNASNRSASAGAAAAPGTTLSLLAGELELGEGTFSIQGFEDANLTATGALRSIVDGALRADGNLTLAAQGITASSGVSHSITASGTLAVAARPATSAAVAADTEPLGASLLLEGRRVDLAGRIDLAGGALEVAATGEASGDDVIVRNGALIDVSGRTSEFDGVPIFANAGDIKLVSRAGGVLVESGASLNVSGAQRGGAAGSISVTAAAGMVQLDGSLLGTAADGFAGGSIDVDAATFAGFTQFNQRLNTSGFSEHRGFRLRGAGDLTIAAGDANVMRAREVALTADQGRINVLGRIDATGERAGSVNLSARNGITVAGVIDASASGNNASGGRIDLHTTGGSLRINPGARLAVNAGPVTADHGGRGGEVLYRAHRDAINTLLDTDTANDAVRLAGTVSGARRVTLEGYERIEWATGQITAFDVSADASNPLFASAESFMQNAAALRSALGLAEDEMFRIVPGIEIFSTGDLTVADDWNLYPWRFGDAPGVLTLRAGGTLRFDASLSDGFAGLTGGANGLPGAGFGLPVTPGDSWSYRLAGGADLSGANLLAVVPERELAAGVGNVEVGSAFQSRPRMVRTGTGNIDIAAARDFVLADPTSVVYTAGVSGPGTRLVMTGRTAAQGGRAYPVDGGDISIAAQGNIKGAATNQLVTDWLWRVGRPDGIANPSATGWTVNFQSFRQNVGAFAGGNVSIRAGNDIENLSASIPSIGRQVGGTTPALSEVEIVGGGYLDVQAGGSIYGGSYFVGLGAGQIEAGRSIGSLLPTAGSFAPILALGDAQLNVTARHDLDIETIVNPTLLPQGVSQAAETTPTKISVFATYSPQSAVTLLATAGDLSLRNNPAALAPALSSMRFGSEEEQVGLKIYPPSLRAAALRGDTLIDGSLSLFPASRGNVELFAHGDVIAQSLSDSLQILLSDADPALLPSIGTPAGGVQQLIAVLNEAVSLRPDLLHAAVPVHADERQADDPDLAPARIVARSGSIVMQPDNPSDTSGFYFAKSARLVAGTDIRDVSLVAQNLRDSDITSLIAGRDFVYTAQRSGFGNLTSSAREITLDGPGRLELIAGRSVDLQTSKGVTTRGNITNPALPDGGASVSVLAGIGGGNAQHNDEFITRYLDLGTGYETDLVGYVAARTGEEDLTQEEAQARFEQLTDYRDQLVAYVEQRSGRQDLTQSEALDLFRGYSRSEQRALVESVFHSELRFSGKVAAAAGDRSKDFSRGFTAIETLFPGANPDVDAGETNPYRGDINLYFSRVYTLDDGDISLLAPGGSINAGLAAPPDSFGISKAASELGVVAQSAGSVRAFSYGDFQVNESRVFAADGGDIQVWATRGDIDAGRGAKTAISAPAPIITFDPNGTPQVTFPAALTGSGIQTLATSADRKPGNVDLFAPRGVVNASDAGIVAGNLTIAATAVLGTDNIQVSGVSVGVPVDAGGLGASLAGVSSVASGASNAATTAVETGRSRDEEQASLADTALSWLEVFVIGLGEENCKQDDVACLKRQTTEN